MEVVLSLLLINIICRFLLSYEQYSKNMEVDGDELKLEEEGEEHGTNGTNGAENLTKDDRSCRRCLQKIIISKLLLLHLDSNIPLLIY